MLTNNKKSFFVKGIALLMAMLMVLSVCLTGCGKAAEEAAKNAQDTADKAVTDAAAAQSAADAVKKELEKYFTSEQTKAEAGKLIEEALKPYATTEALAAFVKSEDFEALKSQLNDFVKLDAVNAAIAKAVEGKVTAAELEAIQKKLAADIKKNETAISDAVNSLKSYATDAEVDAIKKALEDKISKGDKAINDALADYVKTADLTAVQNALNDKIAATDKAVAAAVESLKGYVKADEYALLVSSVQEMTFKMQTLDKEHYGMVMQTLAPYVENQEALASSVQYLMDEIAMIDKKHNDHVVELLAGYTTTENFDLLASAVQALEADLFELHMNVKAEIATLTQNQELLTAGVARLDAALEELHMNVKAEIADHDVKLDNLFAMLEQHKIDTRDMGKEIQAALVNYATKVEVEALEGRLDRLEDVVRGILNAFYTPEEVKTFAEEGFDILDVDPAIIAVQFQNKMNTVDGSMSLADWNATTTKILVETIDNIQKLLERLYEDADGLVHNDDHVDAYLYARKMAINEYLAPLYTEAFNPTTGDLNDSYVVRKGLEYAVLRAANAAELLKMSTAIANALDVNTFADDLKELYETYLYTIGCADADHHKNTQVVTIEHKGEINTFADKFDELLISYLFDYNTVTEKTFNAFEDTKYFAATGNANYNFGKQPTMAVYSFAGKLYTYTDNGASFKIGKDVYTRVGYTIIFDGEGMLWKKADAYGLYYLPTDMNDFQYDGAAIKTVKVDGHHGSLNDIWVADKSGNAGIYEALIQQSYDAQDLIDLANEKFKLFLNDVVKAYGVSKAVADFNKYNVTMDSYAASNFEVKELAATKDVALNTYADISKISDMQFLYALAVGMCTPVAERTVDYTIYLTGAASVQTYVEAALARNTCVDADHKALNHTDVVKGAIYHYDLYQKMIDKAWFLTFELYRTYAYEMTLDILADYISVLDYAIVNPTVDPKATALDGIDTFLANYDIVAAGKLSPEFLNAFLNNEGAFKGWASDDVETQAAISIEKNYKDLALYLYYGALNNEALDSKGNTIEADPIATISTWAEQIRQYLHSASVYPQLAIMNADRAEAQKNHRDDIAYVFEEILNSMVAGLDEVYNRFLLEDFEKVQINKAWDYATETATLFCLDTDKAPLIAAMQDYISAKLGGNNALFFDLLMNEGDTEFDGQLINGSMYTEIFAITVDKFAYIGALAPVIDIADKTSDSYINSATNKRDLAVKVLGDYMIDLDNMAIKYNFLNYLDDATQNLVRAQLNYMKANNVAGNFVLTYDMINYLVAAHNGHNTAISIYKFQEQMSKIPFNSYIAYYGDVLNLISSDKQVAHVEKLLNRTFDSYIYNSANAGKFDVTIGILSTTDKVWVNTALNNVVSPVDVLGTGFTYVGSAVREYDSIVNVNTQYYPNGDTTKTPVNLYN